MSQLWIVEEITKLTGLDSETVQVQILPNLQSIKTYAQISDYLSGLLGTETPAISFITRYLSFRFPEPQTQIQPASYASNWGPKPATKPIDKPSWVKASTPTGSKSSTPRTQTPRITEDALKSAFGTGGTVYVKNKDDNILSPVVGKSKGKGKGQNQSNSQSQNTSKAPSLVPTPTVTPPVTKNPLTVTIAKERETPASISLTDTSSSQGPQGKIFKNISSNPMYKSFSPSVLSTLSNIETSLRHLSTPPTAKQLSTRQCFCRSRIHDLSDFIPICQNCGLIICSIHHPLAPCPSCKTDLTTPTLISARVASLNSQKEGLIKSEQKRLKSQIPMTERFPSLSGIGGNNLNNPAVGSGMNYSEKAGARLDIYARIDKAYEIKIKEDERRKREEEEESDKKVISLNMKTKKAKVTTKNLKKFKKGKDQRDDEDFQSEEEEEGFLPAWIDEDDLGVLREKNLKTKVIPQMDEKLKKQRPFLNQYISPDLRPIYVPLEKTEDPKEDAESDGEHRDQ